MGELTCFKAYDIRGELGVDIDASIAYRIGRAVSQHFNSNNVIVGRDARETSPEFAEAASQGIMDAGAKVLDIGLAGTEEMYWAVTEYKADAGIIVTASHNPINYNGMKIVKKGSKPLDDVLDFKVIKKIAENKNWTQNTQRGTISDITEEARAKYVSVVLKFIDISKLKPLKIVINSGNGAAGPTFDAIANALEIEKAPIEFVRVHHKPDCTFPNGIPNPLLVENRAATADIVVAENADLGVAFDGDFDRCFFFDEFGRFIGGEYILSLLATIFLEKNPGSKIIHDPRVIWNVQDIVGRKGGKAIQSKTGHAFIKQAMRISKAIYGGEMSAHHYFRDFAYCDSGMIPMLLILELISTSGRSLGDFVHDSFVAFPSSAETNFYVEDPDTAIERVLMAYRDDALYLDKTDGVSLTFSDWRFNLRSSNTEPLVRLNIESRGDASKLEARVTDIANILCGTQV